jgi:signal transduction histidine kinase
LTLGPLVLSWFGEPDHDWLLKPARWSLEAIIIALLLILSCMIVFNAVKAAPSAFLPALLYLPLPLILWMTFRFGVRGASTAILIVTVVLVSQTLRGSSPFAMADIETNVLALQLFLTGLSVPVLLLGAAVDEANTSQAATRRLAGTILKAHDEERRRIARGLHESTAQDLVAATLLASQLQKESPEKTDLLPKLSELLQRSIANLRGMSYLLHPPLLDEAGLPLALRAYIVEFSQRSGIRVDADLHDDIGRLPSDVELVLFRVMQEALNNIRRHTESPSARILLSREDDAGENSVVLTIQNADDSTPRLAGLASRLLRRDHLDPLRGTGLATIRERLHQIGGKLELRSAGGLTFVRAIVPSALE